MKFLKRKYEEYPTAKKVTLSYFIPVKYAIQNNQDLAVKTPMKKELLYLDAKDAIIFIWWLIISSGLKMEKLIYKN